MKVTFSNDFFATPFYQSLAENAASTPFNPEPIYFSCGRIFHMYILQFV